MRNAQYYWYVIADRMSLTGFDLFSKTEVSNDFFSLITDIVGGAILAFAIYWVQWTFRTQFEQIVTGDSYWGKWSVIDFTVKGTY